MAVFMVERELKGISMADLAAAQQRAIKTSNNYAAKGTPVRYIRSAFVPDDGRCMCLFDADSAESVVRVNEDARIPFTRVVPALDLPAP